MMADHQWPEASRKRAHVDDPELEVAGNVGFGEHRNKRLQSLPLRTSPTSQRQWTAPSNTITPSNSDSDPDDVQRSPAMDVDRDADMMVDGQSSDLLEPGPFHPDSVSTSITSRMPTPIHPTFAAQVRGNGWNDVAANAAMLSQSDCLNHYQDPSIPRSLDGTPDLSLLQNRRLPSPISEDGREEMLATPGMVLDNCSPVMAQLQRPYLPHLPHSTNPHAMAVHPNIRMSPQPAESDVAMETEEGSPSSAPATPSPRGKYGHSRSKHTLNNWTLQPGMKKSFSIGYRADCEKCRMKIPGHFNHIIIS
ncbi:hypothetical protein F5Y16DRAFT_353733 [Xylariaceae sp. FL0255]|nr:hypothetical protein F5Y16DRAFT_353733 [Xylariaceae sp. FL0255]